MLIVVSSTPSVTAAATLAPPDPETVVNGLPVLIIGNSCKPIITTGFHVGAVSNVTSVPAPVGSVFI